MMRRLLFGGLALLAMGITLTVTMRADALAIAMPQKPNPARVAINDMVIVGNVKGIEDMDVKVPVAPNVQQTIDWRIAVVTVTELVKGKKETKQVRVGFLPIGGVGGPGGGPGPIGRPGFGNPQLQTGQAGLFFLTKHASADFYTVQGPFDFVNKENKTDYEKDLTEAKRCCKLLETPVESLKSKDAKDRYMTACLLITQYRTTRVPNAKTEAVGMEESKLILEALAEADWTAPNMGGGPGKGPKLPPRGIAFDPLAPNVMFGMLGVTEKDGFQRPMQINTPQDYNNLCRDWCKNNAGKYQIQRFVNQ
jgi:hypothetical protein